MSRYNVKDLAEYMRRARADKQPFVLFTGAGCSKSAGIPLASELVREINQKYSLDLKELTDSEKLNYGRCMSALTKDDRRELLQGYIQKAKINWTHIVQALLLEAGYVQRVLTFNFDNILSRSCGLLGLYPSIYDFTSANLDLQNLIIDPAIVHLHGQSHGFVQLNTDEETNRHAELLSQFIANTLSQSPSIFVGYSGQADAFFPLLKEKFTDRKRLFWIGREEKAPDHVKDSLIAPNNVAHYLHHKDADRFFIELAQELECFPPKAFYDPFGHLLDELEYVLDFPTQEDTELDILASTRTILKNAQSEMRANKRPNFELLLMEGKYKQSITLAKEVELKEEEKEFVAWAEVMYGNQLADQAQQTQNPELFEQSIEKYQAALTIQPNMPEALLNWGIALFKLARLQQNSELFEQCIKKYQAVLAIQPDNHEALYGWGTALSDLAQLQQKPELFEQSFEKYQATLAIQPDKHNAFYGWGVALSGLAQQQQKPELFEQSIEKYRAALAIQPDNHETFYGWGAALSGLARLHQKPELFEQSIEKYRAALAIKPDMHEILNNWGGALLDLAQLQQKPALFEASKLKLQQARDLSKKPNYNLACLYALQRDETSCKDELIACQKADSLPNKAHLDSDNDLDFVRDKTWFKDLIANHP
jgi:tetratricopeptide (TPR) repeat protein